MWELNCQKTVFTKENWMLPRSGSGGNQHIIILEEKRTKSIFKAKVL